MTDPLPNQPGRIVVITGPSGAGKDSVIEALRDSGQEFGSVITTTTRAMRATETEGQPYYFISQEEFEKRIADGEMIEWASVYGNLYGSTRAEIERIRGLHPLVIIKVDPQGARTFKQMLPEVTTIFIAPPSFEVLAARLEARNSDGPEVIAKRLQVAREELENLEQWDHVILNQDGQLDEAVQELRAILK